MLIRKIFRKLKGPSTKGYVRVIYLIPSDKSHSAKYQSGINAAFTNLRGWYKSKMNGKTFRLADDTQPDILRSRRNARWFNSGKESSGSDPRYYFFYNTLNETKNLLGRKWNTEKFAYVVYVDAQGETGAGMLNICCMPENDLKGLVGRMAERKERWIGGAGHELGHAFGLSHPDGHPSYSRAIMGQGFYNYPNCILLQQDKDILSRSRFFV